MLEEQRAQVPGPNAGPAELRPFLEAPGPRREKGRGRPVAGADAAGERPFLWGHRASPSRYGPPRPEPRPEFGRVSMGVGWGEKKQPKSYYR